MEKILKNKTLIVLFLILLLAAFLRIYRISDFMTFLGDEGRDALVAKGILEGHFTFLGPRASAGDFFLGPIYYYIMAPFLLLSRYDPIGPAIMIALSSVATVYLLYRFGKEWFGEKAGIIAAALYGVSPLVISYSRSSWNPNLMPIFSLVILYLVWKAVQRPSWNLFLLIGILFGITMQLHYLAVFLGIIIGVFIFIANLFPLVNLTKKKKIEFAKLGAQGKKLITAYGEILAGFIIGISPFLLFEIRHGFPNTKTIFSFIFVNNIQDKYEGMHGAFGPIVADAFFRVFGRLITRFPPPVIFKLYTPSELQIWLVVTIILAVFAIVALFRVKNKLTVLLFSLWLFLGVLLFGFYKKPIYDYYFEFMFPLPFFLVGNALGEGFPTRFKKKWALRIGMVIAIALFIFNLYDWPFNYTPNRQKQKAEEAADFIIDKAGGKPFNFALVTKGNSDHAFRYFFHIRGHDPVTINNTLDDPNRTSVTGQLFVICDFPDCHPLGYSLFEVAGFGRADIEDQWHLEEVDVYKLVPYKGEN